MLLKLKGLLPILYFFTISLAAQQSEVYTNSLSVYNKALDLYQNKDYAAAHQLFVMLEDNFPESSELKANSVYYAAFSSIKLGEIGSDKLMKDFVEQYPNSTKRNDAFLTVANYYYTQGRYYYAVKWYSKVNQKKITSFNKEEFEFKYGYALFAAKNYKLSKKYFFNLLNSKKYGLKAKYYYGFMAYKDEDFENANKYLTAIEGDYAYKNEVAYYLADINFQTGKFEKAIGLATPLLNKVTKIKNSELNKIIGESYFNLKKYDESIPFLTQYKGKKGKWTNTDYYQLGYAYYKQKKYVEAISWFNKIIDGNNAIAQNAYYHLAECYLNTNKKQEALNAFRNASQMDFSKDIKKESWLNYAKLSYEIGNAYQNVPDVLKEYIKQYPKSTHLKEINSLLISSYINIKDYKGALQVLKNKKDIKDKDLFQKASFFRGIQLFNDQLFLKAIEVFNNALSNKNTTYKNKIIYWNATSNYRLGNYKVALKNYLYLYRLNNNSNFKRLNYNIAYSYYKLKEYKKASNWFVKFIIIEKEDKFLLNDAYLRLGDSYFASSNYKKAIDAYQKVVDLYSLDKDYAQFQLAISYGLLGNNKQKIIELNDFIKKYKESNLVDDAYFNLANTYLKINQLNNALENFNRVIEYANNSIYLSRALLKEGLIFYNTNSYKKALKVYKRLVSDYPKTIEARQAVSNIKRIYIDIDQVSKFEAWAKNISFVKVSDIEIDNATYEAAEKQYLANNHKKSINAFNKYLLKFPDGLHTLQAHFYRAQSYYGLQKKDYLEKDYLFVINQPHNEFTEQSLWQLSQLYLDRGVLEKAAPLLIRLEKIAKNSQNKLFAQSNLMKIYYEQKDYEKAAIYAKLILENKGLQKQMALDANLILARSSVKTGDEGKALLLYKEIEKTATGKNMAEAIYYDAYFKNKAKKYKESNLLIQKLASQYAMYKSFGAKGLLLMAKNFNALNDTYQATYILESIIKNFTNYKDLVKEAKVELTIIKKEAAKTNESVNATDNN